MGGGLNRKKHGFTHISKPSCITHKGNGFTDYRFIRDSYTLHRPEYYLGAHQRTRIHRNELWHVELRKADSVGKNEQVFGLRCHTIRFGFHS